MGISPGISRPGGSMRRRVVPLEAGPWRPWCWRGKYPVPSDLLPPFAWKPVPKASFLASWGLLTLKEVNSHRFLVVLAGAGNRGG